MKTKEWQSFIEKMPKKERHYMNNADILSFITQKIDDVGVGMPTF